MRQPVEPPETPKALQSQDGQSGDFQLSAEFRRGL